MQTKRRRLADRPEIILEAAHAVLRERGARALTIDAVAAAAGLSKGGVLHHYASKDALVRALVGRKLAAVREDIEAAEAEAAPGPGRMQRGMVDHIRRTCGEDDEFSRALLLASFENTDALDDYRAFVAGLLARLAGAGGREGSGAVVFFAILGLELGRTLGFHALGADELEPMFAALDRIARDVEADRPE